MKDEIKGTAPENVKFILDNKIEKEFNKYLFEIEKGKFIHAKELLLEFEHSQNLLEDLAKQLEEKYKEIDRLNNIINYIYQVFENGTFEDGCDCIKIYDYLNKLKENKNE